MAPFALPCPPFVKGNSRTAPPPGKDEEPQRNHPECRTSSLHNHPAGSLADNLHMLRKPQPQRHGISLPVSPLLPLPDRH